jgi:hypothetical protein
VLSSGNVPSSPSDAETTPGVPTVQTLGRYELLTPIGRGGMAVVWAARLRGTHGFSKIVAIKTMLPVLSADPRFEAMFLAEAQMASGIKHPNVCEILDLGEDRGTVYLVMESIDGEPLSRLEDACRESGRKVGCGIAARMIAQAARGLHAAHELKTESGEASPVIHRDVSPQNILVTCEGIVKIVDFGVAKAAVRGTPTTAAGVIKGKVAYLAPEQIDARDIDSRVDIFALGIVLHELLGGVHPFDGDTDLATLLAIASPDPSPPLPGGDEAFPAALRAIVARALEKDPAKRFATMRELAIALEDFADDMETTADAVASFVTEILGEVRAKHRREMREAARSADAQPVRATPAEAVVPAVAVAPAEAVVPAVAVVPAKSETLEEPAARSPRNVRAVVFVVGIAGITLGALGLRALESTPRAAAAIAKASANAPALDPAPAEPRLALVTAVAAAPSASAPASAPASASAPSSSSAGRSLIGAPAVRPASSSGKSPAPAASGSAHAPKRGPLDGWD